RAGPPAARPGRRQRPPRAARRGHRRARLARRATVGTAHDTAGHYYRHGRFAARVRPPLPAHHQLGQAAVGAAGAGAAARRGDPADRGLPRRRPALRQRRPPPRLDSRRNRSAGHRRIRDGGAHGPVGQRTSRSPRLAASPRPPRTNQPCPAGQTSGSYSVIFALTAWPSAAGPPSASMTSRRRRPPRSVLVEGAPRSGSNKGFTTLIVPVQEHFPLLAR